jgi:hypothetical protein
MRYEGWNEGWTLRKAEVRLAEHRELQEAALQLHKAPDYTTLHRFLNRLEEQVLVRALGETVRRAPPPSPHAHLNDDQLKPQARSLQWMRPGCLRLRSAPFTCRAHTKPRWGKPMLLWRKWLKWLVVVDTQSQSSC